jgi:hypothetical protein
MNYIVVPQGSIRVKIGYWNGRPEGLRMRYVCAYGSDLEITTFYSIHYKKLEALFKLVFEKHRITNELFHVDFVQQYIDFFESYKNNHLDEINKEIDDLIQKKQKQKQNQNQKQKQNQKQNQKQKQKQKHPIKYNRTLILEDNQYEEKLVALKKDLGGLSAYEQQQIWTTHVVKELYNVNPDQVDANFFDTFIGHFNEINREKMLDLYSTMQRGKLMLNCTRQEIESKYANELSKRPDHYQRIYDTLKLLWFLIPDDSFKTVLLNGECVSLDKNIFFERLQAYFHGLNDDEFNRIKQLYKIKYTQDEILDQEKSINANTFVKHVLKSTAFNCFSSLDKSKKDKNYGKRYIGMNKNYMFLKQFDILCNGFPHQEQVWQEKKKRLTESSIKT